MARLMRAMLAMVLLASFGALGCGGGAKVYVPVDSPIMEFEPPDAAELIEEEEGDEEDGEDVDWVEEMDAEGEDGAGTKAPAGTDKPAGKK